MKAERQLVDGKSIVVIQLLFDRTKTNRYARTVEVHFDPATNYLIRKVIYTVQGRGGYRREEEVVHFKECSPGVFFPEKISGTAGNPPEQDTTHHCVLSDIRVNQPLPSNIFTFRYPKDIYLVDSIKGTHYRVDPEGNPLSAPEPLSRVPPLEFAEGVAPGPLKETQEKPKPLTRWILPTGLALVALGLCGILIRRLRGRMTDHPS